MAMILPGLTRPQPHLHRDRRPRCDRTDRAALSGTLGGTLGYFWGYSRVRGAFPVHRRLSGSATAPPLGEAPASALCAARRRTASYGERDACAIRQCMPHATVAPGGRGRAERTGPRGTRRQRCGTIATRRCSRARASLGPSSSCGNGRRVGRRCNAIIAPSLQPPWREVGRNALHQGCTPRVVCCTKVVVVAVPGCLATPCRRRYNTRTATNQRAPQQFVLCYAAAGCTILQHGARRCNMVPHVATCGTQHGAQCCNARDKQVARFLLVADENDFEELGQRPLALDVQQRKVDQVRVAALDRL